MTNREWTHKLIDHRIGVSDSCQFTASSASISAADPDHGMIYTVYHASRINYGECRNIVAMTKVPVGQPHRAETFIVAEEGDRICGEANTALAKDGLPEGTVRVGEMLDANCYYWHSDEFRTVKTHFGETGPVYHGFIRVLWLSYGEDYYYRDFDIEKQEFSETHHLKCILDGKVQNFTGEVFRRYLEENGLTGFDQEKSGWEHVILTDKFKLAPDGYRYAFATSCWSQPVFVRMKDGSDVLEFVGHIDVIGEYETQSALVGDTWYCLIRGVLEGPNFFASKDGGRTWEPGCRLEFNTTRPQLMSYKGELLVAFSVVGILPNIVRDGRNNMRLLRGTGPDLTAYEEVFFVKDHRGMVYYDMTDWNGCIYCIYSASIYPDKNPQAKDILYFTEIGDLEYIE